MTTPGARSAEPLVHVGDAVVACTRTHPVPRVTADESAVVRVTGVGSGAAVRLDGSWRYEGRDVTIQLGQLGVIGAVRLEVVGASGELVGHAVLDVIPSKLQHAEIDRLRGDLEAVWGGLVLGSRRSENTVDLVTSWSHLLPPLRHLLEVPFAPLAPRRVSAPIGRARRVDVRPSRALANGLLSGTRVPTTQPVPDVDNAANRMVALLLERMAVHADRVGQHQVAEHARRLRRHSTLRGIRAVGFTRPPFVVMNDHRYQACWRALEALPESSSVAVVGPRRHSLAATSLVALYEYWVFLQVLLAVERIVGAPLDPGYSVLGQRMTGGTVRVELRGGTRVRFPRAVTVTFNPTIRPADDPAGATHVFHPPPRSRQLTPDVLVEGPAGLVVLDAKYVRASGVDEAARAIHAKYARIVSATDPARRALHVAAVHPNAAVPTFAFAGYGAVPLLPGGAFDVLDALIGVVTGPIGDHVADPPTPSRDPEATSWPSS